MTVTKLRRTLAETQRREEQRAENERIGRDTDIAFPISAVMSLEGMLRRCVLIVTGLQVAIFPEDPKAKDGRRLLVRPLAEFEGEYKASGERLPDRPRTQFAKQWLSDRQRGTIGNYTIGIGRPRWTVDLEGLSVLNIWTPRARTKPKAPEKVGHWLKHLDYLIPVESEREKFLDWLAHCEQRPEVLPHHGYLMYTRSFGIGRNWLSSVLYRVWRGEVAGVDLMHMIEKGFNGSISGKRMAVVDEAYVGATKSRYSVESDLRRTMTSETRQINPKYGREHEEWNSVRWLLFSNHPDAIPLPRTDRRFTVIANPTVLRPKDYFIELYNMLADEEFIASVAWFLAKRDVNGFNPGALPDENEAKRAVIAATTPEMDTELADLLKEWESPVAVLTDLARLLGIIEEGARPQQSPILGLAAAMRRAGAVRDPRKFVIPRTMGGATERNYVYVMDGSKVPEDVPAAVKDYRASAWYRRLAAEVKF